MSFCSQIATWKAILKCKDTMKSGKLVSWVVQNKKVNVGKSSELLIFLLQSSMRSQYVINSLVVDQTMYHMKSYSQAPTMTGLGIRSMNIRYTFVHKAPCRQILPRSQQSNNRGGSIDEASFKNLSPEAKKVFKEVGRCWWAVIILYSTILSYTSLAFPQWLGPREYTRNQFKQNACSTRIEVSQWENYPTRKEAGRYRPAIERSFNTTADTWDTYWDTYYTYINHYYYYSLWNRVGSSLFTLPSRSATYVGHLGAWRFFHHLSSFFIVFLSVSF